MNSDSAFNCTIPYKIEGKIIKAVKEDRSEHLILWKDIRSISVLDNDGKVRDIKQVTGKELRHMRKQETLKAEHERWDSCFVIRFNKDTSWGRFRTTTGYDNSGVAFDFLETKGIWFATGDGKEELIPAYDIREVHVINTAGEQYVTIQGMLLRVIIDGKCQLLQGGSKKRYGSMVKTGVTPSIPITGTYEPYYIYYKEVLTEVNTEISIWNTEANFRELCSALFAECPALTRKIENKEYGSYSLRKIVSEFNACLQ